MALSDAGLHFFVLLIYHINCIIVPQFKCLLQRILVSIVLSMLLTVPFTVSNMKELIYRMGNDFVDSKRLIFLFVSYVVTNFDKKFH